MNDWQPPKLAVWLVVIGCVLIVLALAGCGDADVQPAEPLCICTKPIPAVCTCPPIEGEAGKL